MFDVWPGDQLKTFNSSNLASQTASAAESAANAAKLAEEMWWVIDTLMVIGASLIFEIGKWLVLVVILVHFEYCTISSAVLLSRWRT